MKKVSLLALGVPTVTMQAGEPQGLLHAGSETQGGEARALPGHPVDYAGEMVFKEILGSSRGLWGLRPRSPGFWFHLCHKLTM